MDMSNGLDFIQQAPRGYISKGYKRGLYLDPFPSYPPYLLHIPIIPSPLISASRFTSIHSPLSIQSITHLHIQHIQHIQHI